MRLLRALTHALIFTVVAAAVLGTGLTGFTFISSPAAKPAIADSAAIPEAVIEGSDVAAAFPPTVAPPPTATPTAQAELEQLSLETVELRARESTPIVPTPAVPGKALRVFTYAVQPGDTLLALAARFGITPETILWANDLGNGELLRVGQDLTILPVSGVVHHVQEGDTLASVAEAYCVETGAVREANGLESGNLAKGQLLIVPGGVQRTTEIIEGPPKPPSPEEVATAPKYTVLVGDNLVSIADAFGVRPSAIQAANGLLNPDLLSAGQQLVIPGGKPGATPNSATATPARPSPPTQTPVAPTAAPSQSPAQSADNGGQYVVKAGDTLYSIARSLGIQAQALQDANGSAADPTRLKIGQTLAVPGGPQPNRPLSSPTPTAVPTRVPAAAPTATAQPPTPTVRPTQVPTAAPKPPAATATQAQPPAAPAQQSKGNPANGQRIAAIAQKYLGYRYLWGGHTPTGFDCTGFTWYVYREAGLNIPQHDLPGQLNAGPRIQKEQLAPGDLVFFQNTYMAGLSHVGIYLGGGRFINAETEKVGVQVRALTDPYWSSRFAGGSRPW